MNTRQGGSTRASASNKRAPRALEGEMALKRLLELAQYEIQHDDPYRISSSSPYNQCQLVDQVLLDERPSLATARVFDTCHCTCPSLIQWTEQQEAEQKKRRNKRKRNKSPTNVPENVLGCRPTESGFSCSCDFNPLCLGSLGGVMDELLEKVARKVQEEEDGDDHDTIESESQVSQKDHVIVLDGGVASSVEEPSLKRAKPSPPLEISYASDDACTVEVGKHKPSGVYQQDIGANQMELDPTKETAIYSTVTGEEMKQVRKIGELEMEPVRMYVQDTILSHLENGRTLTYERYVDELRKWHDSLSFSNPLLTLAPPSNGNDKLAIAIPPGIKNLGATCYLNTQFQCLARIPAFLNGIFSWTQPDENHQMNSVLSSMQLLFARMAYGSEATLTTQEFSDALGLENDEMQDPNEFGRLLLERMHESFQQCAGDLSQLLPRLFHGVTTYETTCMTCRNTTERNEGFMDLNLPIVQPPAEEEEEDGKMSGGQLTITASFGQKPSVGDTNVQYCLNDYVCAEELTGDNQYSCECCQAKRDARRRVTFQELPPILNVQLSRYVFDRKTFAKKKLSDKVLLPRVLMVPVKGTEVNSKYLLCAVMKHRGTSAYSGHYIAEAMDWQTGTWFEFNDEMVKVLNGPSCSYNPEELDTLDKKKVKGSPDAYNMYYVEEGFLATCASSFLTARSDTEQTATLAKVANERENRYSMLTEMCLNDGKVACRLMQRRVGLANKLSNVLSSEAGTILFNRPLVSGTESDDSVSQPAVWVDGDFLRSFLACDKADLGSIVSGSGPLLRHKHLLCEHEAGLHPRTARKCKLLPRPLYDALVSLMLGERRMLNGEGEGCSASHFDEGDVNDCIITPDQNMRCEICAEAYKAELKEKVETVRRLQQLYDAFGGKGKMSLEIDDGSSDSEDDHAYLVSSKFVTKFKSCVNALMKTAAATELQFHGAKKGKGKAESCCEGLDAVDLSDFDPNSSSSELDHFVNSAITCEHGNFGSSCTGRSFRRVSGEVWELILSLFPSAIPHKVKCDATPQDLKCKKCDNEEINECIFLEKLGDWSKTATSSISLLKDIAKRRRSFELLEDALTMAESDDETFDGGPADDIILVHRKDVEAWRAAVKAIKKHTGKSASSLTEKLTSSVFSGVQTADSPAVMDENVSVEGHISASMTSLLCDDHKLPVEKAVWNPKADPTGPCISLVDSCAEPFTSSEYRSFIGSLYDLGILLAYYQADQSSSDGNETVLQSSTPRASTSMMRRLQQQYHPRLKDALRSIVDEHPNPSQAEVLTYLQPFYPEGICLDAECNQRFEKEREAYNFTDEVAQLKANVVNLVDFDVDEASGATSGSSTFSLRAFEIEQGADFDSAISSIMGIPRPENGNSSAATDRAFGSLRRSTRKRKAAYPNGPVLREESIDIGVDYNIAAVRLFLYQQASVPLAGELFVVIPKANEQTDDASVVDMTAEAGSGESTVQYEALELPNSWNEKPIKDVVEAAVEGKDLVPQSLLEKHLKSKVFLCWSKGSDKSKEDTPIMEQGLLDNLLCISNASQNDTPDKQGKKKKTTRRAAERGFAGTLLHSSSSAPNSDETKKSSDSGDAVGDNEEANVEVPSESEKENVTKLNGNHNKAATVKATSTKATGAASTTSDQNVVVLDESDNDDATHKSEMNQPEESISVLVSKTGDNERQLRSSTLNPHEEDIVKSLLTALSSDTTDMSSFIDSECREAARWAIHTYSGAEHSTVDELTSVALAKYYESQQY